MDLKKSALTDEGIDGRCDSIGVNWKIETEELRWWRMRNGKDSVKER
jgi:hypothetical protein